MNRPLKKTFQILGVLLLPFLGMYACDQILLNGMFTNPWYDQQDLMDNYEAKNQEMYGVKKYMEEITPENFSVRIEFKSKRRIDLKVYEESDTVGGESIRWFIEWDINPYNYRPKERSDYEKQYRGKTNSLDLVMDKLGWEKETLEHLYKLLKDANCIGAGLFWRREFHIDYQRSGTFLLSYILFEENLTDSLLEKYDYDNGCSHIFYKENVVLKFNGGAYGPQCFVPFEERVK